MEQFRLPAAVQAYIRSNASNGKYTHILAYHVSTNIRLSNGDPERTCFADESRLHFVDEKAEVNVVYYLTNLMPKLAETSPHECRHFIIYQGGATATSHTARTRHTGPVTRQL